MPTVQRTMPKEGAFIQILRADMQGFSLHAQCDVTQTIAKHWSNCAATMCDVQRPLAPRGGYIA